MGRGRGQRRQPLDDLAAAGADVLPLHRHDAEASSAEEEIDDAGCGETVLPAEPDGIDPNEVHDLGGPDDLTEQLDHLVLARERGREAREPLLEARFVH